MWPMRTRLCPGPGMLIVMSLLTLVSWEAAHARADAPPQTQAPGDPAPLPPGALPDGPGKAVVERACTVCHGAESIMTFSNTVPVWKDTLEVMKSYGAAASDDEWKAITAYVMSRVARVSVNKATADEFGLVFGCDETIARGVVTYRTEHGGFRTIEDLKQAPDLDPGQIDAMKARLIFETTK